MKLSRKDYFELKFGKFPDKTYLELLEDVDKCEMRLKEAREKLDKYNNLSLEWAAFIQGNFFESHKDEEYIFERCKFCLSYTDGYCDLDGFKRQVDETDCCLHFAEKK